MGLFRVRSCCGCNSLQSGCNKIAVVNIAFALLGLVGSFNGPNACYNIVGSLVSLLANVFLLHGVKSDKSVYVLVWLIISGVQLVMTVIATVFLIFGAAVIGSVDWQDTSSDPRTGIDEKNQVDDVLETYLGIYGQTREDMDNAGMTTGQLMHFVGVILWVMVVAFIIIDAIYFYLFIVVKSYYHEMKENERNAAGGVIPLQQPTGTVGMEAGAIAGGGTGYVGVPAGPPPSYDEIADKKMPFPEKC